MNNKTKPQKPFLTPIDKTLFKNKNRSARDHYGKYYMDKILEVTEGKVIYDYEEFNKG